MGNYARSHMVTFSVELACAFKSVEAAVVLSELQRYFQISNCLKNGKAGHKKENKHYFKISLLHLCADTALNEKKVLNALKTLEKFNAIEFFIDEQKKIITTTFDVEVTK